MPLDFEQPRRAPNVPAVPQDASGDPDATSPSRRKTSWFSGSPAGESSKTAIKEEAPGILSRSQLLEGLFDAPKQPKKAKKVESSDSLTSSSNRDSAAEETSGIFGRGFSMITPTKSTSSSVRDSSGEETTGIFGRGFSMITPTKAWKRTSDSPPKTEAPALLVKPEKTRPASIKTETMRPSSGSLTPKGFFKLLSSPKPSKVEPSPTLTITPDTPARLHNPPASKPPARLPPIPVTGRHLKALSQRPRSHSAIERLRVYSKDPWHRHVYAHGPIRIAENTLATRLLIDTFALAAPSPQLPTEEDIDELVGYFAKLLPKGSRGIPRE